MHYAVPLHYFPILLCSGHHCVMTLLSHWKVPVMLTCVPHELSNAEQLFATGAAPYQLENTRAL